MKIKFIPNSKEAELLVPPPKPAKNFIPNWFKEMPQLDYNDWASAKKCPPFTDAFISGYIQELWCDVKITRNEEMVFYNYAGNVRPMSTRMEKMGAFNLLPHFKGYYNMEMHWETQYEPKTPKGFSTIYSHPFNQYDLPFLTLNGIIDTDKFSLSGPLPFLIKDGFEGIIPAGTPIYQINFLKREKWKSQKEKFDENNYKKITQSVRKYFLGGYKKHYWQNKTFE